MIGFSINRTKKMCKHSIVSLAIDYQQHVGVGHQFQWVIFRIFCSVQMQAYSLAQAL